MNNLNNNQEIEELTPVPTTVNVKEVLESKEDLSSSKRNRSIKKISKYILAIVGGMLISTVGDTTQSKENQTISHVGSSNLNVSKVEQERDIKSPSPKNWQLFNLGLDKQTFNVDVKYEEPLTYRVEDISDSTNFSEKTTTTNNTKERISIKLDRPVSKGVKYTIHIASDSEKELKGLSSSGEINLSQNEFKFD